MKKIELISEVANATGQAKALVRSILDATNEVVRQSISRGQPVFLMGLGKIAPVSRAATVARNIHTGESIKLGPRIGVRFTPSTGLVKAANLDASDAS